MSQRHLPLTQHKKILYEYQQSVIENTFHVYQQSVIGNIFVIKVVICYNVFLSQLTILILHYRRKGLFPDSQE